jgi:hypothetical protein
MRGNVSRVSAHLTVRREFIVFAGRQSHSGRGSWMGLDISGCDARMWTTLFRRLASNEPRCPRARRVFFRSVHYCSDVGFDSRYLCRTAWEDNRVLWLRDTSARSLGTQPGDDHHRPALHQRVSCGVSHRAKFRRADIDSLKAVGSEIWYKRTKMMVAGTSF